MQREVAVIPVLVSGATMPTQDQLPHAIKDLAFKQAIEVRDIRFDTDLDILVKEISSHVATQDRALKQTVNAAMARPLDPSDMSGEILELGVIEGVAQAELGASVRKFGRSSGYPTGSIEQVDVSVKVQFAAGRVALFTDQLLAGAMALGGDSGSAVLDNKNNIVGLVIAGSDNTAIINRIQNVFSALKLSVWSSPPSFRSHG